MRRVKRGKLTMPASSMVLNLKPVLEARGINHPTAFLLKIGISNPTVTKMLKGESVLVTLNQLTKLCVHLDCTPNDIFALRDMLVPIGHSLEAIQKLGSIDSAMTVKEWLAGKTLEEIRELLKK